VGFKILVKYAVKYKQLLGPFAAQTTLQHMWSFAAQTTLQHMYVYVIIPRKTKSYLFSLD